LQYIYYSFCLLFYYKLSNLTTLNLPKVLDFIGYKFVGGVPSLEDI
jgi:hypothetical protein